MPRLVAQLAGFPGSEDLMDRIFQGIPGNLSTSRRLSKGMDKFQGECLPP